MQKNKQTVCFFNSAIEWGGGEKWHFDMANALYNSGFNILFFANNNSALANKLKKTNIKTITLKVTKTSFLNPLKIEFVKNKLINYNVSTIIINLSQDLKLAGLSAKKANVKNIIYRRGSAIPIKNSFLNRFIFRNIVTNIIANTEATKKTITQNNQQLFNSEKIKVIYNGIDVKQLFNSEKKAIYKKQENEIVIGNLGRLEKQKAQHLILEIAKELKHRGLQNLKFIIAGSGSLENELKQTCKELNICKQVIFTGFCENVKAFYNSIDIFILSSIWEGFGYVIAEAMAFEKPVVAFNISSNPEIIEDNVTGFLAEYPNIKEFADKLEILIKDKALRLEMGKEGKERTEKLFMLSNKIDEFKEYILNLNKKGFESNNLNVSLMS